MTLADEDEDAVRALAADVEVAALAAGAGTAVAGGGLDAVSGAPVVVIAGDAGGGLEEDRVRALARVVAERAPSAVVLVAAEPCADACTAAVAASELPRGRVVGVAGIAASARLRALVARRLGVPAREVSALAAGVTGARVPLLSLASAGGAPLAARLDAGALEALAEDARAEREPEPPAALSAAAATAAEAVLLDRRRVLSCELRLEGEHGVEGACVAVPVELGAGGVERIPRLRLSDSEAEALRAAAGQGPGGAG